MLLKPLRVPLSVWVDVLRTRVVIQLLKWRNRPRKVLQHPHPVLSSVAAPVEEFGDEVIKVIKKLFHTLQGQKWGSQLGMAAPQIGISKRVFIARNRVFINPEMKEHEYTPNHESIEACYSKPEKSYRVWRYKKVHAYWQDHQGNEHEEVLRGTLAIVFQHELDHLNGICCADVGVETSLV